MPPPVAPAKKKTVTLTPAAPPAQPPDLAVNDCKSALLYSDEAPLASKAKPGQWDLKAVWAHVPSPRPDKPSLLVHFHGHANYVTVDRSGGCRKPDWAAIVFANPCVTQAYNIIATVAKFKQPLVLLPEVAAPIRKFVPDPTPKDPDHKKAVPGVPAVTAHDDAGNLGDAAALGKCVDDCFRLLAALKTNNPPCSGAALLPSKPALSDLQRLYLSGHSGGGVPLKQAAKSSLVKSTVTDLIVLDATYGHDGGGEDFCTAKGKANLGNAADKNRLMVVFRPKSDASDTETAANALRDRLKSTLGLTTTKVAYDAKTKLPTTNPAWPAFTTDMVEILHFADNAKTPSDGNLTAIRDAMKKCPVVFVKTNVEHDRIPTFFIPLVLDSAP
jgi:hypothetical protein